MEHGSAARSEVIVVGAGVAGLASAIWLARAGMRVTVCERGERPGGKIRQAELGDGRVDAGPTVFTLREVFDELFTAAGASLDSHLTLRPLETLARHAWTSDERLDLFADIQRSADAIGAFAGAREARGYLDFCAEAASIYHTLRSPFLQAQKTGPLGLSARVGLTRLGALMGIRPFDTLWKALGSHFADPRLRQLFGRYATYCGSSPFDAPATLMLISHVEQQGVWLVEGGMQRLAESLAELAASLGVVLRWGADVSRIDVEEGRASGVTLASGEALRCGFVVSNADAAAFGAGFLGPDVAKSVSPVQIGERSLSAVTWALEARTQGFPLVHHNVFFSADYAAEFDDLFNRARTPIAPTVYVCAQDRDGAGRGVNSDERLLVLVNAPANGDRGGLDEGELAACETRVFEHLRRCGLEVGQGRRPRIRTTPMDYNAMFPGTGGALYGRAMHGWRAAFRRPGARTRTPGLYLAGGGAHPGAGVPMAALSGRLAAEQLLRDRASM